MTTNKNKHFDNSCAICMGEFEENEQLINTACKHSFHEDCIMPWIHKKIDDTKAKISIRDEAKTYEMLKQDGPLCPNCNKPLLEEIDPRAKKAQEQDNVESYF